MDVEKTTLFALAKKRLSWLTQRQEVLAENIANADTPKYRPKDLEAFEFKELVTREAMQVNMTVTSPGHDPGPRQRIRDFASAAERKPYETAPAGNAVVLEEQMGKVNETAIGYRLTTKLYMKNLELIRTALGKGS